MKILAIDIGGTAIKYGMMEESGEITGFGEMPTDAKQGGGPALMERVQHIAEQFSGYDRIGISTAGQVDTEKGEIIYANENIPNYTGMKVKAILEERFGVPVAVQNDVNAAAFGEAQQGAGREFRNFLCLTYGTGIGGAAIIDGKVYTGPHGIAAEFGHLVTHPDGMRCACGNIGCYEMYGSTSALSRMTEERLGERLNGREVFARLAAGDDRIEAILKDWMDEIILGLASLVHCFDPEAVILGGGIMAQAYITDYIRENLPKRLMPSYRGTKVLKAQLGNRAGLIGAACGAKIM